MHMFCYQCQETGEGKGCRWGGTCGKDDDTANALDLVIWALKGLALAWERMKMPPDRDTERFMTFALFSTITNVNFNAECLLDLAREAFSRKQRLLEAHPERFVDPAAPVLTWLPQNEAALRAQALQVGVLFCSPDEDARSLRETILYGLKGLAAYQYHALILDHWDPTLMPFLVRALAETTRDLDLESLVALALETGKFTLTAMALLEQANTATYGAPEPTAVALGVRNRPGILVTGHDLLDMDELLHQSKDSGVDVYTHSEMIPAHYYPAFKRHAHLAGNYGNAWWNQDHDFAAFNGPILVTSNCITPVQPAYADRIFTTGPARFPGVPHLEVDPATGKKDFTPLLELARRCSPPTPLDQGTFLGGFGYAVLADAADKVIELVHAGKLRRFVVIGGCDGRDPSREYYRDVAEALPADTVILTAGCAKYRFMHLPLGDIEGLPRVLDAGQCNDCYALVAIALKLQEAFGAAHLNDLPISFDIPWYDQKSVAVLLALFHLGVKGIRLGPTHPAFFSARVHQLLEKTFDLKRIGSASQDVAAMLAGH